uniref:Uncharacterized protein n=1 Tax=Triticum urartu TaxID=4572 RepID=A0A8R7P9U4_TRIUA
MDLLLLLGYTTRAASTLTATPPPRLAPASTPWGLRLLYILSARPLSIAFAATPYVASPSPTRASMKWMLTPSPR